MTRSTRTPFRPAALRLALAGAFGLAALPALAQPTPRPDAAGPRGPAHLFAQADANHDGRVTWDEAWARLSARFAEADANHDGAVTKEELRAYAQQQRGNRPIPARAEQRGEAFFRAVDADGTGRVTLAEVQPVAQAMFRAMDRNGDGAITRDELPSHGGARADRPAR